VDWARRFAGFAFVLVAVACSPGGPPENRYLGRAVGPTTDPGTPAPAAGQAAPQVAAPAAPAPATAAAPAPTPMAIPVVDPALDEAAAKAGPLETARRLWADRQALRSRLRADLDARVAADTDFAALTGKALEARGHEPLFTTPDGASKALDALLAALATAADQALPARNDPAPLNALLQDVRNQAAATTAARAELEASPAWNALKGLGLGRTPPSPGEVEGLDDANRLEGLGRETYLAALTAHRRLVALEETAGRARNALEVYAQAAFWRYALDMKFRVRASPFRADADDAAAVAARGDALLAAFDAFAKEPATGLAALVPQHPEYARLVEGLKAYRALATRGPFEPVSVFGKAKLKKGQRGPLVETLKRRLAQEGYFAGDMGPVFDANLAAAVEAYQETHGFDASGEVEERHAKSLNIPVEQRVRQVELGLQRWRESEVRPGEPLYVRVNLPEFRMSVWENGQQLTKHKIVCGNNNWDVDPDNRLEGRINRTKLFTAAIERVILNPRWHVPKRIQKLELEYELLKEPDYYQKHNFVIKTLPDGREEIYQDSGDKNALGRVKFVFPNPYGIYMHDTNLKAFFQREIRAFSHGCIRLQQPFEIMDLLLEKAAGIPPDKGRAMLATQDLREISLKTPVPLRRVQLGGRGREGPRDVLLGRLRLRPGLLRGEDPLLARGTETADEEDHAL
jgi:murein L,D-transpeptidase YcbB/YkuD